MKKAIFMGCIVACIGVAACSSSKAESESKGEAEIGVSSLFLNKSVTASKNYVSKTISVKDFTSIKNIGSLDVEYKHGDRPRVELYVSDNVLRYIDLQVNNKELTISIKPNTNIIWRHGEKSKITVYSPSVKGFTLIGSGNMTINENLTGEDTYNFRLTGSGDMAVRSVKATSSINVNLTGSGDLNILNMESQGDEGIKLALVGSGDLNVNQLKSNSLMAMLTGSGDLQIASVHTKNTAVSVSGSGDVKLKGMTDTATLMVSGSGDLSAGQLKARDVNASATGSGEITCYATGITNFRSVHDSSIRNVAK